MKKNFTVRGAKWVLMLISIGFVLSCHKTPVKNNPNPVNPPSFGKWKNVSALPGGKFQMLEVINNTIYTGSDLGVVYRSTDGVHWAASKPVKALSQITSFTIFKNRLVAGTVSDGIFMSSDGGETWDNNRANFPGVSSFAILGDSLFSSSLEDAGIIKWNDATNQWSAFDNAGLPTNYNLDIDKVIEFNGTLLSIQGENGNFYGYDKASHNWSEKYFFGNTYTAGLRLTDMIYDRGVLYAGYDGAVIQSPDGGQTWSYDTVGLKRSPSLFSVRTIYGGADKIYTIHNTGEGETWIQSRDKSALNKTWATGEEHLPIGDSHAIREFNGMLFLATDKGLYYRNIEG